MPSILIIDDDISCRRPLSRLLELEGYDIRVAGDGVEGLQRLAEGKPDLVLLDLVMPRMDGVGFLQAVRADSQYADLPIFLVTGQHFPKQLQAAKDLGIQRYLFKGDVPFVRMLELIKKQLGEPFNRPRRGRKPKHPRPDNAPSRNSRDDYGVPHGAGTDDDDQDADADLDFERSAPGRSRG